MSNYIQVLYLGYFLEDGFTKFGCNGMSALWVSGQDTFPPPQENRWRFSLRIGFSQLFLYSLIVINFTVNWIHAIKNMLVSNLPLVFAYLGHYNFTHVSDMPLLTPWIHLWKKIEPTCPFPLLPSFPFSFLLSSMAWKTGDSSATAAVSMTDDGHGHHSRHLLPLQCSFGQDVRASLHLVPLLVSSYAELHTDDSVAMGPSVPATDGIFPQLPRRCGSSLP